MPLVGVVPSQKSATLVVADVRRVADDQHVWAWPVRPVITSSYVGFGRRPLRISRRRVHRCRAGQNRRSAAQNDHGELRLLRPSG